MPTPRLPAAVSDQLCFALYAASRAVTSTYATELSRIGLTYPQYLVLMALWEEQPRSVTSLGSALALDSGTLSPILKRLENQGMVQRQRSATDERVVKISLTPTGAALEPPAARIRSFVEQATGLTDVEFVHLRGALTQLRHNLTGSTSS